jgi:aminoglycoside 3-N-acetyltransferase
VLRALLGVLGPMGTVLVPTHTAELSEPSTWRNPPVPQAWWATIRDAMPAFDPRITPSLGMGALAELVRTWPGARRSSHPQFSFAAVGPAAQQLTADHRLDDGCGEGSPLARLYELDGQVLLLGVGHDSNTSLHLAEYRAGVRRVVQPTAPVLVDGARQWVTWHDVDLYSEDFPALGEALEETGSVQMGPVGQGVGRLMHQSAAVDFAEIRLSAYTARPLSQ